MPLCPGLFNSTIFNFPLILMLILIVQTFNQATILLFTPQVEAMTPVAIYAEGKTHAMAIGLTKMSTADMKKINKGIGVDNVHCLNDGLWKMIEIS